MLGLLTMAAGLWLALASPAQASDDTPTRKLGRGVSNITLCFLEIPRSWREIKAEHGEMAGLTWGTIVGTKNSLIRIGVGAYEVLTFPYADGVRLQPEWVLTEDHREVFRIGAPEDVY
jgi:putative exosortase-associated protein (TIGR04073 family)